MLERYWIESPVGFLVLEFRGDRLARIEFHDERPKCVAAPPGHEPASSLIAWFRDPGHPLPCPPLVPAPTPFQERLRAALLAIPPGETRTYGQLARSLGSSPRAVGQACRANPVPLVVPCHRVVSARGPGGYAGAAEGRPAEIKRWLLAHERGLENDPNRPHQ